MTIRDAMHVAANISYWPAAYASLLTYLRIDRSNPAYYGETIRHELEQRGEEVLMREWETMSASERLHVAACVIAEEASGIAEAGPSLDSDEAVRDGDGARVCRSMGLPSAYEVDSLGNYLRMTEDRRARSKVLGRCSRMAMLCSGAASLAAIGAFFGLPYAWPAAGVCAGLMVVVFFAGLVLANEDLV